MVWHKYTEEEKRFFVDFVPGHSHKEIQQEFIRKFGWEISIKQVSSSIKRYNLNTGRTGRFEKGQTSHNKGKKMTPELYEKCKGTMFKKGNIPHNHRPEGSERISKDGYVEIKVAEPNKWMLKHRLVWQQANGEIPEGHIVIFRDNNKHNISLENLMLISRSENLIINGHNLSGTINETKDLAVNFAKLVTTTNHRKRR